jgi:hypothetical protein
VEQRKVSEVPSRDTRANSFQNRRTEFRAKINLNKEKSIELIFLIQVYLGSKFC